MNRNNVFNLLCLLLMALAISTSSLQSKGASVVEALRWQPQKSRVFIVSMTRFKGGTPAPWGTKDRLDGAWLNCLKERGVADSQIEFLTDEGADTDSIRRHFDDFLDRSKPDECLIFYFSSHGSYNAKHGEFSYVTYDGHLPFQWAFDAIERYFKGTQVLMFADCCYSGGIVDIALKRKTAIKYACLSSTYSHNVGFSGWRFFDCILRGFAGAPVVDLDDDGHIELDELARFSEEHMAFVAEGKPMFATTNGFNPRLILADARGAKKSAEIGSYVESWHDNSWHKAEIIDVRAGYAKVHDTDKGDTFDEWQARAQIRPFKYQKFADGARVEVKGASSGKWYPATVMDSWESMHFCRFDGYSSAYDEWVGPSRIQSATLANLDSERTAIASNLSGKWTGYWQNNLGEKGKDSLVLTEDANGNFEGMWTGDISVRGRRLDANTVQLWGQTATRSYRLTGTLSQSVLVLNYAAERTDSSGSYEGKSFLSLAN